MDAIFLRFRRGWRAVHLCEEIEPEVRKEIGSKDMNGRYKSMIGNVTKSHDLTRLPVFALTILTANSMGGGPSVLRQGSDYLATSPRRTALDTKEKPLTSACCAYRGISVCCPSTPLTALAIM